MKLKDIIEDTNPLRNQHDLRKKAAGLISQATRLLAQKRGIQPNPHMVVDYIKSNANASREEIEAVRSLLRMA